MLAKVLLFIIIALGIPLFVHFNAIPVQKVPYPYTIPATKLPANTSPIMIVGDRMALKLYKFKSSFIKAITGDYSKPIEIDSFANETDGLHRTLDYLKKIKNFPKVIIYQGASVEESEYRFVTADIPKILKNFSYYENSKIQTLLIFFPFLSKFVFQKVTNVHLTPNVIIDPNKYSEIEQFKRIELHYKLFENELKQLAELVKSKNSILIMLTTPLNPNTQPKEVCESTTDKEIDKRINEITKLIKQKNFKEAYQHAQILHYMAIGNAKAQYLYSRLNRKFNKKKEALEGLELATSYDCKRWRSNGVYNSIIRKVATDNDVFLYDFSQYLFENSDKNETFFDDLYPQNIYYENVSATLGSMIKKILNL